MDRSRGIRRGIPWLLLTCALLLVPVSAEGGARERAPGPLESFRRAVVVHRALICGQGVPRGLLVVYSVEPRPGQSPSQVRQRMIEVLRRRAGDRGRDGIRIVPRGVGAVEVWYPGSPARVHAMRGILVRPGNLAFHAVDTDSPWFEGMDRAVARWATERDAATVTLERTHDEWQVRADTREELEAFVATLPSPPPARILGFQEEESRNQGHEAPARWRLFLLHEIAPVHGGHIASATVIADGYDGMPRVSLVFDEAGAVAFADLSEALVQRLLAIVLDGRVLSAPKVMERIDGGRAQITLGAGRPPQELFEEARGLAAVLGSGGHPAALVPLSEEVGGRMPLEGWRALGPLPFTAQAVALLLVLRDRCL